jgi:hypothetical protein
VSALQFRTIGHSASSLGITVQSFEVRSLTSFGPVLAALGRERPSAVAVVSSPMVWFERGRIARFALEHRLPAISLFDDFADHGGLVSYGPASWPDLYRQAAVNGRPHPPGSEASRAPDRPSSPVPDGGKRQDRACDRSEPPGFGHRSSGPDHRSVTMTKPSRQYGLPPCDLLDASAANGRRSLGPHLLDRRVVTQWGP